MKGEKTMNKSQKTQATPSTRQTVPTEPPPDWPPYFPWPIIGTGPTIPAPPQTTRETGIIWYEAQVIPETKSVHLVAFNTEAKEVGRAVIQMMNDSEIRFVISQEKVRVGGGISLERTSSGEIRVQGKLNDQEFSICGRIEEPDNVQVNGRLCLDVAELTTLNQWGRIAQPLFGLAQATKAKEAKWGCLSCLVTGAGLVVGAGCCGAGALPCCAGTLIGGGTFLENCKGACA
jgi:hypothetical protein